MNDFEDLLAVQEMDTHADQVRHRLAGLPERERVRQGNAALLEIESRLADAEARRDEIRRRQRRFEDEVQSIEEKASHVNDTLYGGTVRAAKELESLQQELDMLHRRQREVEDHILEEMELAEPIDAELDGIRPDLEAVRDEVAVATAELDVVAGALETELDDVATRRVERAGSIDGKLLDLYERLRTKLGGVGAARLSGNRCEGCHLAIPAGELEEVKRAAPEETVLCPECGRILVR